MAKFIKMIHDAVAFHGGKNVASKFSPSKIDAVTYEVCLGVFLDLYAKFPKTTKISHDLDPFKKAAQININNGVGVITTNSRYPRLVTLDDDNETLVQKIEDGFWPGAVNDKVDPPSASRPIYIIESTFTPTDPVYIKVRPKTITKINYYYFKLPVKPVYAYTVGGANNDKYIYNDAASVDIEFNEFQYTAILNKVLSKLGINLRDGDLINYSELQKSQEK